MKIKKKIKNLKKIKKNLKKKGGFNPFKVPFELLLFDDYYIFEKPLVRVILPDLYLKPD